MNVNSKNIFVELEEDVLPRVKRRSELYARGNPDINEDQIITERDTPTMEDFYMDFIAAFRSETGRKDALKDYEDTFVLKLSPKEIENGIGSLRQMLIHLAEEYHLYRWYQAVGDLQRGQYHENEYQKLLREFKYNGLQDKVIQPTYRPYF